MSKIQTIMPNHFGDSKNRNASREVIPPMTRKSKNLSFGGGEELIKPLTKAQEIALDNALTKNYLGKPGAFFDKISKTAGEIQNIIFIGIGTAFVAPIFIAYNPVSKEDQKTKSYSALRQPISAIISTATGLGINYPIAKAFDKWAAEGKIEKFDMSAKPPANFIDIRYKNIRKNFEKLKGLDKKYFDIINNDGRIKTLADFDEEFKTSKIFEKAIHDKTLNQAAIKLLDVNNKNGLRNITVRDFLVQNMNFEIDAKDKNILNPDSTKAKLKNTTGISFLRIFGFDEKEVDESKLRAFINNNIYKEKVDFNSHERKYITRATEMITTEEQKNKEKISLRNLLKVFDMDDGFYKNNEILDMKMDKFLIWFDKKLDINSAIESVKPETEPKNILKMNTEERLLKLTKNIAENFVKKSESAFKAYSKVQGIILSLAVLPFACGFLNWSYPRVMEKCFPKLAASKAENKGGK